MTRIVLMFLKLKSHLNLISGRVRKYLRKTFNNTSYGIMKQNGSNQEERFPVDFTNEIIDIYRFVRPYTMTSKERIYALCQSIDYIVDYNIPGDVVECGVWRGGSMMAVAQKLAEKGAMERKLYLFDTFEGMPPPTTIDVDHSGTSASDLMAKSGKDAKIWAYASLDEVERSMRLTKYDETKIVLIKGKVEETIPKQSPNEISLLRLDTDWYESTYHELVHLYPRLSVGGVLILDDYGYWEGSKCAVDQYIKEKNLKLLLNRIDYTGRICVKIE